MLFVITLARVAISVTIIHSVSCSLHSFSHYYFSSCFLPCGLMLHEITFLVCTIALDSKGLCWWWLQFWEQCLKNESLCDVFWMNEWKSYSVSPKHALLHSRVRIRVLFLFWSLPPYGKRVSISHLMFVILFFFALFLQFGHSFIWSTFFKIKILNKYQKKI